MLQKHFSIYFTQRSQSRIEPSVRARKGKKRVFIRYFAIKNDKYQPYFKNLLLFFAPLRLGAFA